MSRTKVGLRLGAALTTAALLAACGDGSRSSPLAPSDAPSFVSAGSSSADWQQCANNGRTATPCEWISSVLNPSKATYFEGENIPFRFTVHIVDMQGKTQVAPDKDRERRVTFTYGFTKATNGNYDFIGKFNQTEKERANLCTADFSPVNGTYCDAATRTLKPIYGEPSPLYASPDGLKHSVIPIAPSKFLTNVPQALKPALEAALANYIAKGGKLEIDIFGGRAGSVDDVKYNTSGGDVTATMTVRFFANQRDVLIAFGAHFARLPDWDEIGYRGGAGQSGSPFHIKVDSIDGTGAGALGNNVSGGAVLAEPAISIDKTVSSATVNAGDAFSWTVVLTNGGSGAATGAQIVDPLPAIAGYAYSTSSPNCSITAGTLTCGPTTVAAGGTLPATVTATWEGPLAPASCGTFQNTATGKASGLSDVTDGASVTILCPNVALAKTSNGPTVNAGAPISFTVKVQNTGLGEAKTVSVTDNLPTTPAGLSWSIVTPVAGWTLVGNALTYSAATLASGASSEITVQSATTAATCGLVSNTASGTTAIGTVTGSPATAEVFINCAGLTIVKKTNGANNAAAPGTIVKIGDPVAWTYEVKNTGNVALPNVTITDDKLALDATAIVCPGSPAPTNVIPSLGAGATVTCVASGTAVEGQYSNIGTATSGTITVNDPDFYFGAKPEVEIIKKTNNIDNNTAPGTAIPVGSPVTWTYTVRNTGNVTLTDVTVTDDKVSASAISCPGAASPATSNVIPSLAAGGTVSCTATGTAVVGQYTNIGAVTGTYATVAGSASATDDNPDNYFGEDRKLEITKLTNGTDGPSLSVGEAITWTYKVENKGNVALPNVVVTDDKIADDATAIVCPGATTPKNVIANLAVGASVTCSATGTAVAGEYANIGTAKSGPTEDTDPSNYTGLTPNLSITKTPDAGSIAAGGTATFTVVVKNEGLGKAFTVALSDQLLASLPWTLGAMYPGWTTCSISPSKLLACSAATLDPGATATVTVSAVVPADFVLQTPAANGTQLEMDGNLIANGAGVGATDWANAGISCIGTLTGCALDPSGGTDDSFGNGTKEDTPVPSLTDGSIPPNKSDLLRFYVHNNRVDVGESVHDFVYLAWERVNNPQGTTNMDFEFNQNTALSGNGVTPLRTANDVLFKYDLSQGGDNLTMGYHKWVTSGACEANGESPPCWGPLQSLAGAFQGRANDAAVGSVTDPIAPNAPRQLSMLTFGEASIDMQAAGIFQSGVCLSFGRAYLKSRSSDSFTAAIKDFVKPIPVSISNCKPVPIPNTASVSAGNVTGTKSDNGSITVTVP